MCAVAIAAAALQGAVGGLGLVLVATLTGWHRGHALTVRLVTGQTLLVSTGRRAAFDAMTGATTLQRGAIVRLVTAGARGLTAVLVVRLIGMAAGAGLGRGGVMGQPLVTRSAVSVALRRSHLVQLCAVATGAWRTGTVSPRAKHLLPQLELVGSVACGAGDTLGVETAIVMGLGVTAGTGDGGAGRGALRVRLMAAGARARWHAGMPTGVVSLLLLVALGAGKVGVELRVVRGMATGATGVRGHALLGQRVAILVAAGAFSRFGKIVGLVAIGARGVSRREQQRTGNLGRSNHLWVVRQAAMS